MNAAPHWVRETAPHLRNILALCEPNGAIRATVSQRPDGKFVALVLEVGMPSEGFAREAAALHWAERKFRQYLPGAAIAAAHEAAEVSRAYSLTGGAA